MSWNIETKLLHAGDPDPRILGAVAMPVFQSTMYELEGMPVITMIDISV